MTRSMGGRVLECSLASLSPPNKTFVVRPDVALVETDLRIRGIQTVLAQNAWNFLPGREFEAQLGQYPGAFRRRARARRIVSHLNVRRAKAIVALSETMGASITSATKRQVDVVPVGTSVLALERARIAPHGERDANRVIVPGTVGRYKRSRDAVAWVRDYVGREVTIDFVGTLEDGTVWDQIVGDAHLVGMRVTHSVRSHLDVITSMERCGLVVLPSAFESLSFAMGEALLAGSTVLARDTPAHREMGEMFGEVSQFSSNRLIVQPCPARVGRAIKEGAMAWRNLARRLGQFEDCIAND